METTKQQVGGQHYQKLAIQPIEFCHRNGLGPCESAVVKYVTRHKNKGGVEDLRKAIHYLEILIELCGEPDEKIGFNRFIAKFFGLHNELCEEISCPKKAEWKTVGGKLVCQDHAVKFLEDSDTIKSHCGYKGCDKPAKPYPGHMYDYCDDHAVLVIKAQLDQYQAGTMP